MIEMEVSVTFLYMNIEELNSGKLKLNLNTKQEVLYIVFLVFE